MLRPTEITEMGERHVEKWLTANNYSFYHPEQRKGTQELEARGEEAKLLIHVKTSLEPAAPPELSHHDQDSVICRAMMLGFDPWLASVQLDRHGDLVGEIKWTKLN